MSLWDIATGIVDLLTLPWTNRKADAAARDAVRQQYLQTEEGRKLSLLDEKTKALDSKPTRLSEKQKNETGA